MSRSAVLYARISVATEQSVSVARQLESGRQYAAARRWKVVGEYVDRGVSATHVKPKDRGGWKALTDSPQPFDAVIVWKVDRLARRVMDFLQVDEELQRRGAAIVCVEQSLDLTTSEGRAFAQMLAVFGELETAATSERQAAARAYLLANGRSPGGLQPYGFRIIPNPNGPGRVRAQDPQRAPWTREMADRALRGDTIYSIVQWLDASDAPPPAYPRSRPHHWHFSMVNNLLQNPVLAGMYPCNPGRGGTGRGPEVLRGEDGNPVIGGDAIISTGEHDALVYALTHKGHHSAIKNNLRAKTSILLSGIITCAECGRSMVRSTSKKVPYFECRHCLTSVNRHRLLTYIEGRLLSERGRRPTYRLMWTVPNDATTSIKLAQIDSDLRTVALELTGEDADVEAIATKVAALKTARNSLKRRAKVRPVEKLVRSSRSLDEVWRMCVNDEQRQQIMADQIDKLTIARLRRRGGRAFREDRVTLTWRDTAVAVVPDGVSLDAAYAYIPEPSPWMSSRAAAELLTVPIMTIRNAAKRGDIQRRSAHRSYASLSRESVEQFGRTYIPPLSPAERADQRASAEWISITTAAELIGCHRYTVTRYLRRGAFKQRPVTGREPSLNRESVDKFATRWRADLNDRPWSGARRRVS
ncbi:hypothetical protein D0Z08_17520 [Nocardioides immobilis]|uniref:Resolvase/invertase-type recombinase catalytic domain-containing protein n=1 Tax=Nocardioides immobilis TaxID=2049295 RepID=A0A417XZQ5_9ACTN|nr:recombinase family protein [Nocardioides immobilis]RHW25835.1 hypothetical protein D0Z08_17520 [Nocardioides immobilis]